MNYPASPRVMPYRVYSSPPILLLYFLCGYFRTPKIHVLLNSERRAWERHVHQTLHCSRSSFQYETADLEIMNRSGSPPLSSTIRPLVTLLSPPPESATNASNPRDLLPTFESLLALTNLASTSDQEIGAQIIRLAAPQIEELVLSSNLRICRAATELCCNLTLSPSGIALFASRTLEARRRIHILLALADHEDAATRRAAGGAIAGIVGDRTCCLLCCHSTLVQGRSC